MKRDKSPGSSLPHRPMPSAIQAPASRKSARAPEVAAKPEYHPNRGLLATVREWTDAIIIAYVLAMFIRTFVVELFKIPSGSMTPTLIGDPVAEVDIDNDGQKDLLVLKETSGNGGSFQVYLRDGKELVYRETREFRGAEFEKFRERLKNRYDRILVNKFAFWFHPPRRGNLIVFKVPQNIWSIQKPIYIKRAVAFGGERVTLDPNDEEAHGRRRKLLIDGKSVEDPAVFLKLRYGDMIEEPRDGNYFPPPENEYVEADSGFTRRSIWKACNVPQGRLLALGDNTDYSSDGRYWGTVPIENLKGMAFFRYWPIGKAGFLK